MRLDYHISEDFFFEATYGRAKAGKTSFELLSNVQLLSDAERRFTYYNLSLGYNVLPGEVFIGRNLAMTSALYLIGGIGSVKFAGDQNFTVNFGAGFQRAADGLAGAAHRRAGPGIQIQRHGHGAAEEQSSGHDRRDRVLLVSAIGALSAPVKETDMKPTEQRHRSAIATACLASALRRH